MKQAIVLHSGGMDSSICLALAIQQYGAPAVLSLGFAYGQRHHPEFAAAERICQAWSVDRVLMDSSLLGQITDNALINKAIPIQGSNTLVVGRNGLMAELAGIYANLLQVHRLYMGVIECDAVHTGYRDCSRVYWEKRQELLRMDLGDPTFEIRTPLIQMTKKETLSLAQELGVLDFLLKETITCYEGLAGEGCRVCHACRLRNDGIRQFYGY